MSMAQSHAWAILFFTFFFHVITFVGVLGKMSHESSRWLWLVCVCVTTNDGCLSFHLQVQQCILRINAQISGVFRCHLTDESAFVWFLVFQELKSQQNEGQTLLHLKQAQVWTSQQMDLQHTMQSEKPSIKQLDCLFVKDNELDEATPIGMLSADSQLVERG